MDLCFCDSEFNRQDLLELGYRNVQVVPILMDFSLLDLPPDRRVREGYDDNWTNLLFVGRIAPNKKQEDVIRIFHYYKTYINPRSRLFLVGTAKQMPRYLEIVKSLVESLSLKDVIFTGRAAFFTTWVLSAHVQTSFRRSSISGMHDPHPPPALV